MKTHRPQNPRGNRGFTLIELLVVISIIALLISILVPALGKARDQAKRAVCMTHQRQVVMAMQIYLDDNEGKFCVAPNHGLWDNGYTNPREVRDYTMTDYFNPDLRSKIQAYWGIAYRKYTQGKEVFHCPSHKRVDDWPEDGPDWGLPRQHFFYYCSYGLNSYVASYYTKTGSIVLRQLTHFKRPLETVVIQDHIEQKMDSVDADTLAIGPGKTINLPQWRPQAEGGWGHVDQHWKGFDCVGEVFRHTRTSVLAFLDGHAEVIKETKGEDISARWYTGR